MNAWYVAIASGAMGIVTAVSLNVIDHRHSTRSMEMFVSTVSDPSERQKNDNDGVKLPVISIEEGEVFNFGRMEINTSDSHVFKIVNKGQSPLFLTKGTPTCRCTDFQLSREYVLPGHSAEAVVEWKPNMVTDHFEESAPIMTNDPARAMVSLTILGQVTQVVTAVPSNLALGRILASKPRVAHIKVYGFPEKPLQIDGFETSTPEFHDRIDLQIKPMSEGQLSELSTARSGQELILTIKKGLPLGPLTETIRLRTNFSEVPFVEIPLKAKVVGDISIVGGQRYRDVDGVLVFGPVKAVEGAHQTLHILIRGAHRQAVKLSLDSIDPDGILRASIGEPKEINRGAVIKIPLKVEIMPGSRPVSRRGTDQSQLGLVRINTTHPEVPSIPIYVDFAVQE